MKTMKTLALCFGMAMTTASCGTGGSDILTSVLGVAANSLTGNTTASGTTASSLASQLITGTDTKSQLARVGVDVLSQVLSNRSNSSAQKGTAQSYSGTYTAQLLVFSNGNYQNKGSQTSTTATTNLVVGSESVGVSFPAITAGGASMSQVTLNNLTATSGVYGVTTNSTCTEGQLTYGGKTYDLANAYLELKYSGTTSLVYSASIYFDLNQSTGNYNYAMNLTFQK